MSVALPDLAFFTGVERQPTPLIKLPFALRIEEGGLVRRVPCEPVERALDEAYARGSALSTEPGGAGYAAERARELLEALAACGRPLAGARVLEVGCGAGHALRELSRRGARVRGCELGPSAWRARELGLEVTEAPFARGLFAPASFDLVCSNMLLEHLEHPDAALAAMAELLAPGGVLWCGVPDCEGLLERGDLNLATHQHRSYFTRATLSARLARAGLGAIRVHASRTTLSLQASARKLAPDAIAVPVAEAPDLERFAQHLRARVAGLEQRARALGGGRRLGLCGASLAASAIAGWVDLSALDVHVFERDPEKVGGYLPGIARPIVADEQLAEVRPDELWVLPALHGASIASRLAARHGLAPRAVLALSAA